MTDREDIIRMAQECDLGRVCGPLDTLLDHEWEDLHRFADLVAAAEREKIARQWDAMHDKYMADPMRRQMMLSYEMVANLIRGRT